MMLDSIGRGIDRLVSVFSPMAGARRAFARQMYAAAKTTRLTGAWAPTNASVNAILGNSALTLRARVRQLVRDFPYFARAVNVLVDHTVGDGFAFQAKVRSPNGEINRKLNQQIEDAWSFWSDEADLAGKSHFSEICRLAKRQDVEIGEGFMVISEPREKRRFLPFAVQLFEADWLSSQWDTYPSSLPTEIYQGIEYDRKTGRVLAYHFVDPERYGKQLRIPAEQVIHGYDILRPGQLRGVSPFAPAVLVAHDLGDYMDAELDAAKMAAKWLAFIETANSANFQAIRGATDNADTGIRSETIENALLEYLQPGDKVTIAEHNRPGQSFEPFTALVLRMVAVTVGVSYELLSGDYRGLNYSVLRGIRNDLQRQFLPIQGRHIRHFCQPIKRLFLDWCAITGRVDMPGYFSNPWPYQRCLFMPPGSPPVDPLKEGRADADAMRSLLKSPQEIAAARGRDYEDILDEIAEAREMVKERGLTVEEPKEKLASNPAAMDDNDEDEDDKDAGRVLRLPVTRRSAWW